MELRGTKKLKGKNEWLKREFFCSSALEATSNVTAKQEIKALLRSGSGDIFWNARHQRPAQFAGR